MRATDMDDEIALIEMLVPEPCRQRDSPQNQQRKYHDRENCRWRIQALL